MEEGPAHRGSNQARREDDRVEGDVVLSHELVERDVLSLPPLRVVLSKQVGSD